MPCDNQAMKEKETMKQTKDNASSRSERDGQSAAAAPTASEEETERRIDEIAERHRETLERLARD